jgi:hypothetical protein
MSKDAAETNYLVVQILGRLWSDQFVKEVLVKYGANCMTIVMVYTMANDSSEYYIMVRTNYHTLITNPSVLGEVDNQLKMKLRRADAKTW